MWYFSIWLSFFSPPCICKTGKLHLDSWTKSALWFVHGHIKASPSISAASCNHHMDCSIGNHYLGDQNKQSVTEGGDKCHSLPYGYMTYSCWFVISHPGNHDRRKDWLSDPADIFLEWLDEFWGAINTPTACHPSVMPPSPHSSRPRISRREFAILIEPNPSNKPPKEAENRELSSLGSCGNLNQKAIWPQLLICVLVFRY